MKHNICLTICLFCQIIAIYTHFDPITQWNRAINIFISLLIHLLLLFATIRHNSPLFVTIRHYSSLFVTIRHYSRLFALFGHHSSLFAAICIIRSPFVIIRDYLHYSVTIRHYSRLFALFGLYCKYSNVFAELRVKDRKFREFLKHVDQNTVKVSYQTWN